MGYIRHNASLAIGYPYDGAADPLEAEMGDLRTEMGDGYAQLLIGPVQAATNGYVIYALLPDGSKEGWSTSQQFDGFRERFLEIMSRQRYWDVVDVEFGGDEPDLLFASCSVGGHVEASRTIQPAAPPANAELWR